MEFIQLSEEPTDGIAYNDRYCFGIRVPLPDHARSSGNTDYLFKFREHPHSSQNDGDGWYCDHTTKMPFKLHIILY